MPFDPTLPIELTAADAAQMRAQFNGIVDLIQTIPVGPAGPQGIQGSAGAGVAGAVVDSVTTGNPGDSATAGASFDGTNVHFTFGLPRGEAGPQGVAGQQGGTGPEGGTGPQGATGPQGPPGPQDLTGTAMNPTSVLALAMNVSNPPTQNELQTVANKIDELIANLKR